MFRWLRGPGAVFKDPLPGSTNYLNAYDANGRLFRAAGSNRKDEGKDAENRQSTLPGEEGMEGEDKKNFASGQPIPRERPDDLMPFPLNRQFRSQPVLSEELREEIWHRSVKVGESVKVISANLGIEMARVGAAVRLKTVEKDWIQQGKPLASPYARAILAMLPTTPYHGGRAESKAHEPINDLPVHRDTLPQIFHPVSESRHFTRADAGQVFRPGLLPADARIPHPELVELQRERLRGVVRDERVNALREKNRLESLQKAEREKAKREKEERATTKVVPESGRWEFRFKDISVEDVGHTGRDRRGVGARYGFPHEDRKRGQIKIPRRVE
ncbi:MAG: hypothetical protein Q9187_004231 [Circinaria calcarea]